MEETGRRLLNTPMFRLAQVNPDGIIVELPQQNPSISSQNDQSLIHSQGTMSIIDSQQESPASQNLLIGHADVMRLENNATQAANTPQVETMRVAHDSQMPLG